MLPNPNYAPAEGAQFLCAPTVAVSVRHNLGLPITSVIPGQPVASRATMPETAVNENRHPLGAKNKIRLTRKIRVPPPARNSGFAEQPQKHAFRRGITF